MEAKALAEEQKRLNPDCWKRKRTNSVRERLPLPKPMPLNGGESSSDNRLCLSLVCLVPRGCSTHGQVKLYIFYILTFRQDLTICFSLCGSLGLPADLEGVQMLVAGWCGEVNWAETETEVYHSAFPAKPPQDSTVMLNTLAFIH